MNGKARIVLAASLIAIALVLMIAALLPNSWWHPPKKTASEPSLNAEVLRPRGDKRITVPKGARLEASGYLTILRVPPTPAEPKAPTQSPAAEESLQPAVPAEVAAGIRLFARLRPYPVSDANIPKILVAPPQQFSRVILRDGCFRLDEDGQPLVVFTIGTRLLIDDQGYLAFTAFTDGRLRARIGEEVFWEGERRQLEDPRQLAIIHGRCGPGQVQVIGLAQSVAVGQARSDRLSARSLADLYGLPFDAVLEHVRACRQRMSKSPNGVPVTMIATPCGMTPPPPVAKQEECPPGTSLTNGMCRTPEGYARPIPDWLNT